MAWIESHQDLATNPKTKRAARLLEVSVPQVIGHLHMLWWWALDHAFEGDVSSFDALDLAEAAGWEDDPDDFVKALMDCGPGDKDGFLEPGWHLHDWPEFTKHLRAKREASAVANHVRHHVKKGVRSPDCDHCTSEPPPNGVPTETKRSAEPETADSTGTGTDRNQPTAGARKRATRLPEDWEPEDEPKLVAAVGGPQAARQQLDRFRDYWRAKAGKDGRKLDWQATWRNWLRRTAEDMGGRGRAGQDERRPVEPVVGSPEWEARQRAQAELAEQLAGGQR